MDIDATDLNFNNYTSLGEYNSTMNFFVGTFAQVNGKPIDLNDNEYIRIKAYSFNEKL